MFVFKCSSLVKLLAIAVKTDQPGLSNLVSQTAVGPDAFANSQLKNSASLPDISSGRHLKQVNHH